MLTDAFSYNVIMSTGEYNYAPSLAHTLPYTSAPMVCACVIVETANTTEKRKIEKDKRKIGT